MIKANSTIPSFALPKFLKTNGIVGFLLFTATCLMPFRVSAEKILEAPSPENIVYQYMTVQSYTVPRSVVKERDVDSVLKSSPSIFKPQKVSSFLWVPPHCQKLKGVILLAHNVPEEWLGGHPAIRAVCEANDLAIVYTVTARLMALNAVPDRLIPWSRKCEHNTAFLRQILEAFAKESGFTELPSVPWLPMGESMSLQFVDTTLGGAPEQCLGGVWLKDAHWQKSQPGVPALGTVGSAREWDEPKFDPFSEWKQRGYAELLACEAARKADPARPLSYLLEPGSAHFSVTEKMILYIADYVGALCKLRLRTDGSPEMKPVDLAAGFVCTMPTGKGIAFAPKAYLSASLNEKNAPWFPTMDLAERAYRMADVDWQATTPMPAVFDRNGKPVPYGGRGVMDWTPELDQDGVTFVAKGGYLDTLPMPFPKAGTPLKHPSALPLLQWTVGPLLPLGNDRFRLFLTRAQLSSGGSVSPMLTSTPQDQMAILRVLSPSCDGFRLCTHPVIVHLKSNGSGKEQSIEFEQIPDQHDPSKAIMLRAKATSGLPVSFLVESGPAVIHGNTLTFAEIPRYARHPVTVNVVAWQWGNKDFRTASIVRRSFRIFPSAGKE